MTVEDGACSALEEIGPCPLSIRDGYDKVMLVEKIPWEELRKSEGGKTNQASMRGIMLT